MKPNVGPVNFIPDGKKIVIRLLPNLTDIWTVLHGRPEKKVTTIRSDDDFSYVSFSHDGIKVLTGAYPGVIAIWDASTGARMGKVGARRRRNRKILSRPQ